MQGTLGLWQALPPPGAHGEEAVGTSVPNPQAQLESQIPLQTDKQKGGGAGDRLSTVRCDNDTLHDLRQGSDTLPSSNGYKIRAWVGKEPRYMLSPKTQQVFCS